MANSMGPAPIIFHGSKVLTTTDEGEVTSFHSVPIEQFAHNIQKDGDCLCGPNVDYFHTGSSIRVYAIHFALDASYYFEDPDLDEIFA